MNGGRAEPSIQLVCLDMAGTTVSDDGLVEQAFGATLDEMGIGVGHPDRSRMSALVRDTMGRSKIEVFRSLFGNEDRALAANTAFEQAFGDLIGTGAVQPLPGAAETIGRLRSGGMRVALTTGFSVDTRERLIAALGWEEMVDLRLSPADAGRGRPYPDMILTARLRLEIGSVRSIAVVGDTPADMLSGVRAGASIVAGVLSGAGDRAGLLAAGATSLLETVVELPALVGLD